MQYDEGGEWGASVPFIFGLGRLKDYLRSGLAIEQYLNDSLAEYSEYCRSTIRELISCIALLTSKGIEREAIAPSEAVNRKRATAGRAPLPSYTIVRLTSYRKANGIGTHASPVPHMRRGHVRTLPTGKKTIVRPVAEAGSMPRYRVTGLKQ